MTVWVVCTGWSVGFGANCVLWNRFSLDSVTCNRESHDVSKVGFILFYNSI